MGHYDSCRDGYCPVCGAAPGNLRPDGSCPFCSPAQRGMTPEALRERALIAMGAMAVAGEMSVDFIASEFAAIAREARREALEEAARMCEEYGASLDNDYNRRAGDIARLGIETADDCAAAIRALQEPT